jgi:hypothetical protein
VNSLLNRYRLHYEYKGTYYDPTAAANTNKTNATAVANSTVKANTTVKVNVTNATSNASVSNATAVVFIVPKWNDT